MEYQLSYGIAHAPLLKVAQVSSSTKREHKIIDPFNTPSSLN